MFSFRRVILFILKLRSCFGSSSDLSNPAKTGHLGEPLGNAWWFQQVGQVQVHIRADRDLGWEVFVWDPHTNRRLSKPSFRTTLKDAFDLAVYLQRHYRANPPPLSSQQLLVEMVHG